jgi:hypothetical protein
MNQKGQFQLFFLLLATHEFRPAQKRCRTTWKLAQKMVSNERHPGKVKQTDWQDRQEPAAS